MIEGKPCISCKTALYKRLCSYMPGGAVYVCSTCKHEYTVREYETLTKAEKEKTFTHSDMVIAEGTSRGSGKTLVFATDINVATKVSDSLKKLLEEKEDSNITNILASFDDPIEEV